MKKKIILIILFIIIFLSFPMNVNAMEETSDFILGDSYMRTIDEVTTVYGDLIVTENTDKDTEYILVFDGLLREYITEYTSLELSINTTYYDDHDLSDKTDYYKMINSVRHIKGLNALSFKTYHDFEAGTVLTFYIKLYGYHNGDCDDFNDVLEICRYTERMERQDLELKGNVLVNKSEESCEVKGVISFTDSKPYINTWYKFEFQCLLDFYRINSNLISFELNTVNSELSNELNEKVILYKENNTVYLYLPSIVNTSDLIINFKAIFGDFTTGRLENSGLNKISIKKINDYVKENIPVSSEFTYLFNTCVENPINENDIVRAFNITAYDDRDEFIGSRIECIEVDNYKDEILDSDVYDRKLGDYSFLLKVKDEANNEGIMNLMIRVIDDKPPTILDETSKDLFTEYTADLLNDNYFIENLLIEDNYYKEFNYIVHKSEYESLHDEVGIYPVSVDIIDGSLNSTTYTFNVNVIDKEPPVFSGVNTFYKNASSNISAPEIAQNCISSVRDAVCGNCEYVIVEDNYSLNSNNIGEYTIMLKAEDEYHNESFFTITVYITDTISPYFYITNSAIVVPPDSLLSQNEIFDIYKSSINNDELVLVGVVDDTYTESYSEKGVYTYSIRVLDDNEEKVVPLSIKVEEKTNNQTKKVKVSWFKKVFDKVFSFIVKKIIRPCKRLFTFK